MKGLRVLVVEDEILIAKTIQIYLHERGHVYLKNSISYDEAVKDLSENIIDLVLIDIKLYSQRSGIELARFLREHHPDIPFVFLTSQYDQMTLEKALETFPAGYLTKPIHKESLWTTIELAAKSLSEKKSTNDHVIIINDGNKSHKVQEKNIQFVEADHVYIKVVTSEKSIILSRKSLTQFFSELKSDFFIQCHRSFVVNLNYIKSWNNSELLIADNTIPVSRSKRKETIELLQTKR